MLFYFITFTCKWFVLAVAAVSAKLRAILLYKICKVLQFLCCIVNSAHDSQFYAHWPILHNILHAQNPDILNYNSLQLLVAIENVTLLFVSSYCPTQEIEKINK